MLRPSFSMPFVKPPGIIPYVDKSILSEFSYKAINCRPEAPWIKRCEHGIKFTEEIQSGITPLDSETEKKMNEKLVYVDQNQYELMKDEYENLKLKAKSNQTVRFGLESTQNIQYDGPI